MADAKSKAEHDASREYGGLNRPIFIAIGCIFVLGSGVLGEAFREDDSFMWKGFFAITAICLFFGIRIDAESQKKRKAYQAYREVYHGNTSSDQKQRAKLIAELTITELSTFQHRRLYFWIPLLFGSFAFLCAAGVGLLIVHGLDNFIFDFDRSYRKLAQITSIVLCGTPFGVHYWRKLRKEFMEELNRNEFRIEYLRTKLMEVDEN